MALLFFFLLKREKIPQFTPPDSPYAKWSNSRLRVVYRGRPGASPAGRRASSRLGQLPSPSRRSADPRIPRIQPGPGSDPRIDPRPADSSQDPRIPRSGPSSPPQPDSAPSPRNLQIPAPDPLFHQILTFWTPAPSPPPNPPNHQKLTPNHQNLTPKLAPRPPKSDPR